MISKYEVRRLLPEDNQPITSLDQYRSLGGLKGLEKARSMSSQDILQTVKDSGLRGRGGAGFPTGIKWQTLMEDDCPTKYVVCNCAEGEPGTYKDRFMIGKNPYPLLEGCLIAVHALKAVKAVIGTKAKFLPVLKRLREAIAEFEEAGLCEKEAIEIYEGPNDYLFGEEKGLVEAIDGRGALPRVLPPYMLGIRYSPTSPNPALVNNAESLSQLSLIFGKGVEWFRSAGSEDTPGTMIFTLTGDVKNPGMYELPLGITIRQLLFDVGGGPVGKDDIKAVFSGAANKVITPDIFDTPLDFGTMRKAGSGLGSGGFIVYDGSVCMVKAALLYSRFLSQSSCGQCIPCVTGTANLTQLLEKIENGQGTVDDIQAILTDSGRLTSGTRCFLPAQEMNLVPSVVEKFREEFENHCLSSCRYSRELVIPKIEWFEEETRQFTYEPELKGTAVL